MALSLYELSIPNYLQILGGVSRVLQKGADHAAASDLDLGAIVDFRMREDMFPFSFQVVSVWHHSLGAINGIREGLFQPPPSLGALSYRELQGLVNEASDKLAAASREEIDALESRPMLFKVGDRETPFSTTDFIQSFSFPNFYFHAATTYAILRMQGVPLGKMDFLGQIRTSADG